MLLTDFLKLNTPDMGLTLANMFLRLASIKKIYQTLAHFRVTQNELRCTMYFQLSS